MGINKCLERNRCQEKANSWRVVHLHALLYRLHAPGGMDGSGQLGGGGLSEEAGKFGAESPGSPSDVHTAGVVGGCLLLLTLLFTCLGPRGLPFLQRTSFLRPGHPGSAPAHSRTAQST